MAKKEKPPKAEAQVPEGEAPEGGEEAAPKKKLPILMIAIAAGAVVVLGGGGATAFFLLKPKPAQVADAGKAGQLHDAAAGELGGHRGFLSGWGRPAGRHAVLSCYRSRPPRIPPAARNIPWNKSARRPVEGGWKSGSAAGSVP